VTHHIDHDLYNRSHGEDGDRDADDSDWEPCAANKCEQNEDAQHD
jgi:hypothetical protein